VRNAWLAPVGILVSLVVQLTVLNGLRLPGGGVPDLVLILVAALAVTEGPLWGMIIGFTAGLCLDLAPPGSLLIGQYALVFCLAGWAAGQLSRSAGKSPLRCVVLTGIVVAAAEVASAGIGLVLDPADVTTTAVRVVLPASIGYDLVLCPFVLYLVVVTGTVLTQGLAAGAAAVGLPGLASRSQGTKEHRPLQPRLSRAAARTGDVWLGGASHYHRARPPSARTRTRLRPANGVAGSASGLARQAGRHPGAASPSLRLAGSRRGDGAIGNSVGSGSVGGGTRWQPGRHPGMLAGAGRQFHPRAGQPGGSATRQHGAGTMSSPAARSSTPIRFSAHRGDGTVGRTLGSAAPRLAGLGLAGRRAAATPKLRPGTGRSALATRSLPRVVPKVQFHTARPAAVRRQAAAPRFRRGNSSLRQSGTVSGGVLSRSSLAAARGRAAPPRLRLAAGRRASGPPGMGMLGGSGRSPMRGPRLRLGKQPRFGYGRRSLLSFLTGRRFGGSWLARKRAGRRSGVWLIGKRTGGAG